MNAIDLYAGIGGWALGMRMAGIKVTNSYEWWKPAAQTHEANLTENVVVTDIRKMSLDSLPPKGTINVVVGSPPCTQFSYSNRGGGGDVADGLKDLYRFLEIVRHLEPEHWALENVPRVAKVLEREIKPGGALHEFSDLFKGATIDVYDMSDFGIPQRRKRCIAGNFDRQILSQYAKLTKSVSLGHVVDSLAASKDPVYAPISLNRITDNEPEAPLSWEEARFNRDMKEAHPVYNGMPFPEPLTRPSRTVTATCTRVSRESLVVPAKKRGQYRRLSVRERASLQGFPVQYQFLGNSHAEKLKMIGNAIPPVFTYYLANAFLGTPPEDLVPASELYPAEFLSDAQHIATQPEKPGRSYPENRRFRFAIPNLRFKSGTRFELSNVDSPSRWNISFYFGDSKRIYRHDFDHAELQQLLSLLPSAASKDIQAFQKFSAERTKGLNSTLLQNVWTRKEEGEHPFNLIDAFGDQVAESVRRLESSLTSTEEAQTWLQSVLFDGPGREPVGFSKLSRNLYPILVGAALCATFNSEIENDTNLKKAA